MNNSDRAAWARNAIVAFMATVGGDREDALPDLLTDLMHMADVDGDDFDDDLRRARGNYEEEIAEERDDNELQRRPVCAMAIVESLNGTGWHYCPVAALPIMRRLLEYGDETGSPTNTMALDRARKDPTVPTNASFQMYPKPGGEERKSDHFSRLSVPVKP